jgi:glutamate-1-semialdehyde 2,1-aminomutase
MGRSNSAGVPDDFVRYTLTAPFNDKDSVRNLFAQYGKDIAAVIVEPVPANMGVVPEQEGFLRFLREITDEFGSLLLFDEVITGFRLTLGGAQQYYGIKPDLTTIGKIVGGGFPAAAFGGRREIMQLLAPLGPVYQAGTLSGNPIAMTAGIATLQLLSVPGTYEALNAKAERFILRLQEALEPKGIVINHVGNMFTPYFTQGRHPHNFHDVQQSNLDEFARFWRYMFHHGVYLSPSQFESNFISIQHTEAELDNIIKLAKKWK